MAGADLTAPQQTIPQPSTPSASGPDSSAAHILETKLGQLATRRNALRVWHSVAQALCFGLVLAAVPVLLYRFYILNDISWQPIAPLVIALFIGLRLGFLRRGSVFDAALEADEKLDSKERLSSALAFIDPDAFRSHRSTQPQSWQQKLRGVLIPQKAETRAAIASAQTVLVPSLVREAAEQAKELEPRKIFPLRWNRAHRVLALCAAILLAALLMPDVPWLLSAKEISDRGNIALQGKGLVEVAKEVKQDEKKPDEKNKRLASKLEALGQKMLRGRMGKKEALTSLGQLREQLKKAVKSDGPNQEMAAKQQQMQQALEQLSQQSMDSAAGKKIQGQLKNGDAQKAAKEMEKLADKLDKGDLSKKEKEQVAKDIQKMAQALKKKGGEQNQKMAEQLEQAAKSLQQQQKGQKKDQQQNQQQQNQQDGQSQKNQNQQGQQGGEQQSGKQGAGQGAAGSMRQMARSLRQNGASSNSEQLRQMQKKIEEAESNTGSNSSGQAGMGKAKLSQGDCQGGGDCNGVTPGKDLKSSDPHGNVKGGAGLGPRNNATGSKSGGGVSKIKSKRTGDKRRWEDVWSDRVPSTHKKVDRIQGKYGDEGETEQLPTRTEAKGGPVKTPYYDVYESYNKDAEDAVNKEKVPPAYKQPVKEYFESIKP